MRRAMKSPLLTTALVIGIVGATQAQQTVLGADQRQHIEGIIKKWVDAFNNEDWDSQLALYINKSPVIGPLGIWHGKQEAIQGAQRGYSKKGLKLSTTTDTIEPLDINTTLYTANYTVSFPNSPEAKGAFMLILQNDGGAWKILASSASRQVPIPSR
jgi:ketosteroid isomerase-like protein